MGCGDGVDGFAKLTRLAVQASVELAPQGSPLEDMPLCPPIIVPSGKNDISLAVVWTLTLSSSPALPAPSGGSNLPACYQNETCASRWNDKSGMPSALLAFALLQTLASQPGELLHLI